VLRRDGKEFGDEARAFRRARKHSSINVASRSAYSGIEFIPLRNPDSVNGQLLLRIDEIRGAFETLLKVSAVVLDDSIES
jgi:hypothetical protein